MATLWWSWKRFTLSSASEHIGEIYRSIEIGLPRLGYTGVVNSPDDVHGFKGDLLLAVKYLPIGGRDFWQVIACGGGGTVAEAQAAVNEVTNMIDNFASL